MLKLIQMYKLSHKCNISHKCKKETSHKFQHLPTIYWLPPIRSDIDNNLGLGFITFAFFSQLFPVFGHFSPLLPFVYYFGTLPFLALFGNSALFSQLLSLVRLLSHLESKIIQNHCFCSFYNAPLTTCHHIR